MNHRYISFDLEIEQPNTRSETSDSYVVEPFVIQVGYVVFQLDLNKENPVFLEEQVIHLQYPHPISNFIKSLTSIEDEDCMSSFIDATDALKMMKESRERWGTSPQLVQWGGGDDIALLNQSAFKSMHYDVGFTTTSINAKQLFQLYASVNGIKPRGGLSKSMSKLGLTFPQTKWNNKNKGAHWSLTDAKATAIIFNKLMTLISHKKGEK
jgi:hypothetical protein